MYTIRRPIFLAALLAYGAMTILVLFRGFYLSEFISILGSAFLVAAVLLVIDEVRYGRLERGLDQLAERLSEHDLSSAQIGSRIISLKEDLLNQTGFESKGIDSMRIIGPQVDGHIMLALLPSSFLYVQIDYNQVNRSLLDLIQQVWDLKQTTQIRLLVGSIDTDLQRLANGDLSFEKKVFLDFLQHLITGHHNSQEYDIRFITHKVDRMSFISARGVLSFVILSGDAPDLLCLSIKSSSDLAKKYIDEFNTNWESGFVPVENRTV